MKNSIKMSLDEYLAQKGLSSPVSDYLIDKLKGSRQLKTEKGKKQFEKSYNQARSVYSQMRNDAIKEYNELVRTGKVIPKNTLEKSLENAKGFYELDSVQASRRLCLKRCIHWNTGEIIPHMEKEKINMKQMTHNEYRDYVKTLADRLNSDPNYTLENYIKDLDDVNVVDFDLDKYHLNETTKHLINVIMDTIEGENGSELLRGHIPLQSVNYYAQQMECPTGSNLGFNGYFSSDQQMMIIHYAEGDFNISLYDDYDAYLYDLDITKNYYLTSVDDFETVQTM